MNGLQEAVLAFVRATLDDHHGISGRAAAALHAMVDALPPQNELRAALWEMSDHIEATDDRFYLPLDP